MSSLLLLFAPCQAYAWISCLRVAPNHAPAYILRAIPRLSVLQGRTTHGNDCEKPAPSSCALLSHTRAPKNDAKNETHSGSGPPQGPSEAHTHVAARIQSPHKVEKHTRTLSFQRSDTAFAPAAKDTERYEQVDSLIELLGDRYEHVDALIELLDK